MMDPLLILMLILAALLCTPVGWRIIGWILEVAARLVIAVSLAIVAVFALVLGVILAIGAFVMGDW